MKIRSSGLVGETGHNVNETLQHGTAVRRILVLVVIRNVLSAVQMRWSNVVTHACIRHVLISETGHQRGTMAELFRLFACINVGARFKGVTLLLYHKCFASGKCTVRVPETSLMIGLPC